MKKFLLYALKWQIGSPLLWLCLILIPINNTLLKTIAGNIVGAILFYKVDKWIFKVSKN